MSDKSHIEWTDATWNPVTGCTKVSQGCKHCYAERDWTRLSANTKTRYHGRAFTDVQCHSDVLALPLRWQKPRRIFVNSMADLFHEAVPDRFIADVFGVMAACPEHTFQLLTKRPERALQLLGAGCMGGFEDAVEECLALYSHSDLVWPLPNVWLGVSVEDQGTADSRISLLLQTPAAVRWISAEPLLGPVDLTRLPEQTCASECCGMQRLDALQGKSICDLSEESFDKSAKIDWVVAGGESGPKARSSHPDWFRSLRDQCAGAGTPFLFKQWGEWISEDDSHDRNIVPSGGDDSFEDMPMVRVGKKAAGRLLDGALHDGYPEAP